MNSWLQRKKLVNIHKCFGALYGSCIIDRNTISSLANIFKSYWNKQTDLHDLSCSGCSATATNPAHTICNGIIYNHGGKLSPWPCTFLVLISAFIHQAFICPLQSYKTWKMLLYITKTMILLWTKHKRNSHMYHRQWH